MKHEKLDSVMSNQNGKIKVFSMFSGIGGFELGIINAIGERADFVAYSEIDKYAIQIYEKHFKHKNYGDITNIDVGELPDFDLLVGGFPCQSFSIAGKRKGFDEARGTLFFEILRICAEKRPRFVVLENVKGLLSHDSGKTFQTILKLLSDVGFRVEWQVLNSKNFGVPQNRERVFIVGHLRGESRRQIFPITGGNPKTLNQIIGGGQGNRVYNTNGVACTQASQAGGQGAKTGLYAVKEATKKGYTEAQEGDSSFTLTGQDKHGVMIGSKIRRLTPTECERLQGFPVGWSAEGVNGKISDRQRYKTLGNAVTVNVIKAIMEKLIL